MTAANQNNLENRDGNGSLAVSGAFFTWSNLISASRLVISFPIVWLHYQNGLQVSGLIVALVVYGILSDYLDGIIARRTNRVSELGKILDPVADKLTAFVLLLYTVVIGWVPLWYFILEITRDLLILSGSIYIKRKMGKVAMAVTSGKVAVNAIALYWLSVFFLPEHLSVQYFFMGASVAMMVYSFFDYLHRFNQILKGQEYS